MIRKHHVFVFLCFYVFVFFVFLCFCVFVRSACCQVPRFRQVSKSQGFVFFINICILRYVTNQVHKSTRFTFNSTLVVYTSFQSGHLVMWTSGHRFSFGFSVPVFTFICINQYACRGFLRGRLFVRPACNNQPCLTLPAPAGPDCRPRADTAHWSGQYRCLQKRRSCDPAVPSR